MGNNTAAESLGDDDPIPADEIGTVFFLGTVRAELRVLGKGRLGFAVHSAPTWEWVVLREVKTMGQVRRLIEAITGGA